MTLLLIASLVLLAVGLGFVIAWGRGQAAALRAAGQRAERGRSDGARELADLREANTALQTECARLRVQAGESQVELASLSYSISHDLRAPLRSVDGFSQALAEDYGHCLNSTAHDYLRRVRANAQHMSDLIDQLLALARIVRATCRPEELDLSLMAKETAAELSATDPARRVEWDIMPGVVAQGDRTLVALALRHALGNAWKFTVRRPVAHIAFRSLPPAPATDAADAAGSSKNGTVYQVRDDGVGFDMQYAGKLFGAFQRMHPPEEFPGHGIGLAAVQRIVRQHGGSVWLEAAPDLGATLSFTLDATASRQTAAAATRLVPPMPSADAGTPSTLRPRTTAV